jgi:hypothetical protein
MDIAAARTGRAFIVSALTGIAGVTVIATSSLPLLRDFGRLVGSTRPGRPYVPKAPIKIGKEKRMKDPYDEGVANRIGPESCVGDREVAAKR